MDLMGVRSKVSERSFRLGLKFWMQNIFLPHIFSVWLWYFFFLYPRVPSSAPLRKLESSFVRLYSTGTCSVHSCSPALWWGMRHFTIFHTKIYLSPLPSFCTSLYSSFSFKIFRYISCLSLFVLWIFLWQALSNLWFQRRNLCTMFWRKIQSF